MPPLVSIHIITYNQIDFIHDTLLSALEQDYENLEVVVADDCSTDGTADVILDYAKKYPGRLVPVLGDKNLGITGNCNRALKKCSGKYIAFQGGDDVLLPGKITKQVEWFEADERRVLCGHQVEVFYEGCSKSHKLTSILTKAKGPKKLIKYGPPFGATSIMVKADSIPKNGFDERLKMVSDNLFFIECLINGGIYGYISDVYARYRKHANNFTNNKKPAIQELEKVFEIIKEKYPIYIRECNYGKANLVDYGLALYYLNCGQAKKALTLFWKSFLGNPYNCKTVFRLLQTLLYILIK